jgi:hypothetical protein
MPGRIRGGIAPCWPPRRWTNTGSLLVSGTHVWQRIEALVNLRNRNDIALAIYPLRRICSGLALGRSGFRALDRLTFRQFGLPVAELDVTPLLDTGHLWDNYYNRPEIARAIVPYLYFTDANTSGHVPPYEWQPPAAAPGEPIEGPVLAP